MTSPHGIHGLFSRYGLATVLVAFSAGLRWLLLPVVGITAPFLVFYPAVILAVVYGGFGPGLWAVLLSALSSMLFLESGGFRDLASLSTIGAFVAFILVSLFIAFITERMRRAQYEAREAATAWEVAEHKLQDILASITDAFYALDREYRFTYLNPQAEAHFGRGKGKLLGAVIWDVFPAAKGTIFEASFRRALQEQTVVHFETPSVIRSERWIEMSVYPSPNGLSAYFQDITDRKRTEREREELLAREQTAREEAVIANRAKDEFLATVSHELRSPLHAILGWVKLLQAGKLSAEEQTQGFNVIERNARAQVQLIEDLLEVSRIITGKLRLDVRPVDLAATMKAALDSIQPMAKAKGVEIQASLDPLVGPVSGDAQRLQQVIWNLISNAIKFTPRGGHVQVVLRRVNTHAEMVVRDTGQGFSPDFLTHAFERFQQASAGSTRKHGGLGLGLAIVRHLVELHGGTVRADSAGEGQGATFTVQLPLCAGREVVPAVEQKQRTASSSSPQGYQSFLSGVNVLVVDDDADARELLSTLLRNSAATVYAADSVAQARALLAINHVDVILSDIEMPNEDGYSFLQSLRRNEATRAIPAVALTAYARSEDRTRALLAGFQLHLPKPVEPAELVAVVANMSGRARLGQAG